jgi:small subunit ribosomal protein S16
MKQNEEKIDSKKSKLEKAHDDNKKSRIEAEKQINDARAAELAKKNAALAAKTAEVEESETKAEQEAAADETPVIPVAEETSSEPVAENKPQE